MLLVNVTNASNSLLQQYVTLDKKKQKAKISLNNLVGGVKSNHRSKEYAEGFGTVLMEKWKKK